MQDLPEFVLSYIFAFLDPSDLSRISRLCTSFYACSRSGGGRLWKAHCMNRFFVTESDDFYEAFRGCCNDGLWKYGEAYGRLHYRQIWIRIGGRDYDGASDT